MNKELGEVNKSTKTDKLMEKFYLYFKIQVLNGMLDKLVNTTITSPEELIEVLDSLQGVLDQSFIDSLTGKGGVSRFRKFSKLRSI